MSTSIDCSVIFTRWRRSHVPHLIHSYLGQHESAPTNCIRIGSVVFAGRMAVRQTPTHAHTRKTDHAVLRRISITSAGDVAYRQQLFLRDKLQTTAISDRHTARRGTYSQTWHKALSISVYRQLFHCCSVTASFLLQKVALRSFPRHFWLKLFN